MELVHPMQILQSFMQRTVEKVRVTLGDGIVKPRKDVAVTLWPRLHRSHHVAVEKWLAVGLTVRNVSEVRRVFLGLFIVHSDAPFLASKCRALDLSRRIGKPIKTVAPSA
jgi:hypothetical protein